MTDHRRRLAILGAILTFSIVSTAIHYTHNFVKVDSYPGGFPGDTVVQIGIVLLWPVLTAVGLYGYRLYSEGRLYPAHVCLALYSFLGITTLGHFLNGSPDIPAFFYATIFTDGIAGLSMLGFVVASAYASAPSVAGPSPASGSRRTPAVTGSPGSATEPARTSTAAPSSSA